MLFKLGYYLVMPLSILSIFVFVVPPFAIRLLYEIYSRIPNSQSLNTQKIIEYLINKNEMTYYRIERNTDSSPINNYFDPEHNVISLNQKVYDGSDLAGLAITLHEFGHALQNKDEWTLYKIRNVLMSLSNVLLGGCLISIPIGLCYKPLSFIAVIFLTLFIGCYTIEIVVEINASIRASRIMKYELYVPLKKRILAESLLFFCALTYVASLISQIFLLMELLSPPKDEEDEKKK